MAGQDDGAIDRLAGAGVVARNALLNVVGLALPLVVGVVTLPVIVDRLGRAEFGVLTLAWVFATYLTVFDLGLGRSTTRFVADSASRGAPEEISEFVWTALRLQALLGVVGGLLFAAFTPLLVGALNVPQRLVWETEQVFFLLALALPLMLLSVTLRGVLEASQRFDLVNFVRTPVSTINFLAGLAGALLGFGLPAIVAIIVLAQFAQAIAYFKLATRVRPELRTFGPFHRARSRQLLAFGGWLTVSDVVGPLLIYVDRFMVGVLLSVAAVGFYAAPFEMMARLWIIPYALAATLFPAFTALSQRDDTAGLRVLAAKSLKYLLLAVGAATVVLAAVARPLLTVWLGPAFARESAAVLRLLALGVLVNSLANVPYYLVQARGRPDLTAKFHLAELPIHFGVLLLAISVWGIAGAAFAWVVRVTLDAALLFGAAHRLTGLEAGDLVDQGVGRVAVGLAGLGIAAGLSGWATDGYTAVALGAVALAAFGLVAWRALLSPTDRQRIRGLRPGRSAAALATSNGE
jgi:O-antigen/teichoic acid export membrane protein